MHWEKLHVTISDRCVQRQKINFRSLQNFNKCDAFAMVEVVIGVKLATVFFFLQCPNSMSFISRVFSCHKLDGAVNSESVSLRSMMRLLKPMED